VPTPRLPAARATCLGLFALAGIGGSGCFVEDDAGLNCNAALFTDGAELVVSVVPVTAPAAGSYRVAVEAEGEVLATTVSWWPDGSSCADGCELVGERITLNLGYAGPSWVPALVRFAAAPGGPSEIAVTVSGDGGTGSALVRPTYRESEPNGEGCGIRTFAQESFALPLVAE
jgi:hypothetical protein